MMMIIPMMAVQLILPINGVRALHRVIIMLIEAVRTKQETICHHHHLEEGHRPLLHPIVVIMKANVAAAEADVIIRPIHQHAIIVAIVAQQVA